MPIGSSGSPVFCAGFGLTPLPMLDTYVPFNQPARYRITGVTKNSANAVLPGCTVEIYETVPNSSEPRGQLRGTTVSDANGYYSLEVTSNASGLTFKVDAYLAGSPDVAGTTVNTLVGTPE